MKKIFFLILCVQSVVFAQSWPDSDTRQTTQNQSVFDKNQKFDSEGVELYDSNLEMKDHKKFGLGVMVGGAAGLIGLNLEINLDPTEAIGFGLGAGSGYNSFQVGWKHNFIGNYLSPYTKVGYSKWFNSASSSSAAGDSDILKRVLTDDEIKNNRFSADFIVASGGLEYNQLEGELSGMNLFGELVMMAEVQDLTLIPSGAVGIIYYY
ncbi:MAG: hypothetical protein A2622_04795 [Bdellovibrionales bacterium RIFCSPHIGHO2_01_FULL_40_29]|nr:MAG: hypothetical protein A2622_04795 [Bdellovibrionales bacterium RIFCSPHIGHO2_01_FULL_40_29]OFZ34749.1 MAG: hypothetical protein A3D17_10575 [Bdellovibrionales bacterium RIFCSPHIGHO2_02_FULL_40_15]